MKICLPKRCRYFARPLRNLYASVKLMHKMTAHACRCVSYHYLYATLHNILVTTFSFYFVVLQLDDYNVCCPCVLAYELLSINYGKYNIAVSYFVISNMKGYTTFTLLC